MADDRKSGFTVNTHRFDPYKTFKFRVLMGNQTVLGVSKVSALKRSTESISHRSGGDDSHDIKSPGKTTFEPITMERGLTHDLEFERWANMVSNVKGDPAKDLVGYKKMLTLEVMNERGQPVKRYWLNGAWVSEYTAMPDLDAGTNAIAIESLQMQIDSWERDETLIETNEAGPVE